MVREHCTREVVVGRSDETLTQAAQRMRETHVGALIVVDGETRVPVGMLTDRDIVVGPVAQAVDAVGALTIGDVMSTPAICIQETDSTDAALTTMARHGIRRLPVVDVAGGLVGVLAVDDILGHVTAELGKLISLMGHEAEREVERRPA